MGEARYFPAGIVLVDDAALSRSHDDRLRRLESRKSGRAVAALDRFFDFANRIFQHRTAPLVHFGPSRDHARGFAGGLGIGHRSLVRSWRLRRVFAKATRFTRSYGGENSRRQG